MSCGYSFASTGSGGSPHSRTTCVCLPTLEGEAMEPPALHASWKTIGLFAAAACLLANCSSAAGSRPRPAGATAASFACNQPFPAARPGQVVLSGVGYGSYHAGQDPNYGVYPSSGEVAADMPTLSAVTNYIRIYGSSGIHGSTG